MTSWSAVATEAPELAALAQARVEATGLALIATLRADGSPRISGVEPTFLDGDLWLGMMDASWKARDLQRDPRFSMHNATEDKEVKEGDVKISGRAGEVVDADAKREFMRKFGELNGYGPPDDSPYHLFRLDVTEVVTIRPNGDHLLIETWHEGRGTNRIERY
jgi:hypothetical protein